MFRRLKSLKNTFFSDTLYIYIYISIYLGTDLALPVMRKAVEDKKGPLTEAEATATIQQVRATLNFSSKS